MIVGATTHSSEPTILFAVGAGAIGFGPIFFLIGSIFIQCRRRIKMRQAIAKESEKYSTRSPTACSWRLNVTRIYTGIYRGRRRSVLIYHVSKTVSLYSVFYLKFIDFLLQILL